MLSVHVGAFQNAFQGVHFLRNLPKTFGKWSFSPKVDSPTPPSGLRPPRCCPVLMILSYLFLYIYLYIIIYFYIYKIVSSKKDTQTHNTPIDFRERGWYNRLRQLTCANATTYSNAERYEMHRHVTTATDSDRRQPTSLGKISHVT